MESTAAAPNSQIELDMGVVEYEDSGGEGPILVLIGGLAMDWRLWRGVIDHLGAGFRCIVPNVPLGSHRRPLNPDADLSLIGMGRIIGQLIERLDLDDVTLVFNDWSCGQTMIADGQVGRVGRIAFVSCETAANYPPGAAGKAALLSAKLPGGISMMRQTILRRPTRRLPTVYGQMSKQGVPDELLRSWLEPLARPEIQNDVRKYVGDVRRGRKAMEAATAVLGSYERPVLVVWDRDGKMMPNEEGEKLAASFPDARLVWVDGSYTLMPIDQPEKLAAELAGFATG